MSYKPDFYERFFLILLIFQLALVGFGAYLAWKLVSWLVTLG